MMALTHHLIVRYAALKIGIANFVNYRLLGDDLLIFDEEVARSYLSVLKTLDMPVSLSKTYMSSTLCEFAKR